MALTGKGGCNILKFECNHHYLKLVKITDSAGFCGFQNMQNSNPDKQEAKIKAFKHDPAEERGAGGKP